MAADVTLIIEAIDKTQGVFGKISLSAAAVLGFAAKTAVDFDTAISSASRALDLSTQEVASFSKQARDIAPALGLAPSKFAQLSAEAGKLGVSKENIIGFAKNIAELGLITDSTDEQIVGLASSFAALQTITGASNEELNKAGALFNTLDDRIGNNVVDITEFTRQTAATGKLLKLSIGDLAAYGAAFGAIGVKNATAYRAFNSLLTKLAAPQVLSKTGRDALTTLGISADDLTKRMTTDANGGIDFFLGKIRDLAKTDVSAALGATKQIIGADFGDEILTIAFAADKYKQALSLVGDESGNAAKKTSELEKKAASVKGQMAIASANAQKLGIILGGALIPSINQLIQSLLPGVEAFGVFAEANPAIIKFGAILLGLVAAIAPVLGAITAISTGIASITAAVGLIGTFIAGAIPLIATIALVAGALGGVLLVTGLVVGAAIAVVANWGRITQLFTLLGGVISGAAGVLSSFFNMVITGAANTANQLFSTIGQLIASMTSTLGNFVGVALNLALGIGGAIAGGIKSSLAIAYNSVTGFLNNISSAIGSFMGSLGAYLYNAGVSVINQLIAGITASFNNLLINFNNQLTRLRSYLPSSDADRGALSDLSASGAALWQTFGAGLGSGLPVAERAIAGGSSQLLPNLVQPNGGGSTQSITVNFSPSVSGNSTGDLVEALRAESRRLVDMLKVESSRLNRGDL